MRAGQERDLETVDGITAYVARRMREAREATDLARRLWAEAAAAAERGRRLRQQAREISDLGAVES